MKKVLSKPIPFLHPSPICLIGSIYDSNPNFTTVGDIAVAGLNPALVMVSLNMNHACMDYINKTKKFSINVPTVEMIKEVDYAGIYSGKKKDKSFLFETDFIDQVPIIKKAPINLIVEEINRLQIEHRVVLVCSVAKTLIDYDLVKNNKIDLNNIKTILYGLDNIYYSIGKKIGIGYSIGKKTT